MAVSPGFRAAGVIGHRLSLSREQMAVDRTIAPWVMFTRCHNTTHSSCYYTRFTPCKCGRAENDSAPPAAHTGPTAPGPPPTLVLSWHNDRAAALTMRSPVAPEDHWLWQHWATTKTYVTPRVE